MSQVYKAIIADDEPILRRHLQAILSNLWPQLEIVGVAANGEEAWGMILELEPDLAFLDIRMPILDGLSLARRFAQLDKKPLVVFTTAYDQHAIDAFESEAIDYLLKPIEENRLQKAINRVTTRLDQMRSANTSSEMAEAAQQHEQDKLQKVLQGLLEQGTDATPEKQDLKWIKANKNGVIYMLDVNEIDYFQADSKYTSVVSNGTEYLIKTPISALEKQLDNQQFWRIHRNCLLRVEQIARVERDFAGHMFVYLKQQGTKLSVSRSYQGLFKQM